MEQVQGPITARPVGNYAYKDEILRQVAKCSDASDGAGTDQYRETVAQLQRLFAGLAANRKCLADFESKCGAPKTLTIQNPRWAPDSIDENDEPETIEVVGKEQVGDWHKAILVYWGEKRYYEREPVVYQVPGLEAVSGNGDGSERPPVHPD